MIEEVFTDVLSEWYSLFMSADDAQHNLCTCWRKCGLRSAKPFEIPFTSGEASGVVVFLLECRMEP